jgi:hypothetical protein
MWKGEHRHLGLTWVPLVGLISIVTYVSYSFSPSRKWGPCFLLQETMRQLTLSTLRAS